MFRTICLIVSALAFVGQALALEILVGTSNFTASQLLQVPSGPYVSQCTQQCNPVNATIIACGDTNDSCLCTADVLTGLENCEQCMFNTVVSMNMRAPDVRVGSNPGLSAYLTACNNTALPKVALTIAPTWDGPTDIILNTPATVVVVGFGAMLAGSALYLLSSI